MPMPEEFQNPWYSDFISTWEVEHNLDGTHKNAGGGVLDMDSSVTGLSFAVVAENEQGEQFRTELEIGEDGRFTPRVVASLESRMNQTDMLASGPDIAIWGDSLVQQPLADELALLSGHTVRQYGVGGENSHEIAARQGGSPYLLWPTGGVFPASGNVVVEVTSSAMKEGVFPKATDAALRTGTVAGIHGELYPATWNPPNNVYEWRRTVAGDAVTVSQPVPLYFDSAFPRRRDIHVFWAGQNDNTNPEDTPSQVEAMVTFMEAGDKRFIVMTRTGESPNTGWTTHELEFLRIFGRRFINTRLYLINYGLADAGITPTAQDQDDMANGIVPESLRIDEVHHTVVAQQLIARQVYNRMRELRWL